jgi:hypothetical protein
MTSRLGILTYRNENEEVFPELKRRGKLKVKKKELILQSPLKKLK